MDRAAVTERLAEGGLHAAVAGLRADGTYRGESDVALGDGYFSVAVEPDAGERGYRLTATGELRDGHRVLHRTVLSGRLHLTASGDVARFSWQRAKGAAQ